MVCVCGMLLSAAVLGASHVMSKARLQASHHTRPYHDANTRTLSVSQSSLSKVDLKGYLPRQPYCTLNLCTVTHNLTHPRTLLSISHWAPILSSLATSSVVRLKE